MDASRDGVTDYYYPIFGAGLVDFDSSGAVTHVGILWEQGRIIHASGKVRVDKIDHHGIFNEDLKRYTHTLKVVRQIF